MPLVLSWCLLRQINGLCFHAIKCVSSVNTHFCRFRDLEPLLCLILLRLIIICYNRYVGYIDDMPMRHAQLYQRQINTDLLLG